MKHEEVRRCLQDQRIEWRFNIERAAWWGGFFERMVGSMKRCLRKMIGRATLTQDELLTAVIEIEMVLNSRPLSYVSSNDGDTEEALTPSYLLTGHRILGLPDHLYYDQPSDPDFSVSTITLTKRMKCLNQSLDYFWKRWRTEYLLSLRERHKFLRNTKGKPQIMVGDVVVVHDEAKKRGFWNLGVVKEIIPGNDGVVRGAVVSVYRGKNQKLLRRSIAHLYPLELNTEGSEEPEEPIHLPNSDPIDSNYDRSASEEPIDAEVDVQPIRPSRRAAIEARDRIIAQRMTHEQ